MRYSINRIKKYQLGKVAGCGMHNERGFGAVVEGVEEDVVTAEEDGTVHHEQGPEKQRRGANKNIIAERTKENYHLSPPRAGADYVEAFRIICKEAGIDPDKNHIRTNGERQSKVMFEAVIVSPWMYEDEPYEDYKKRHPETMERHHKYMQDEYHRDYFEAALASMQDRFGKENIVSAVVHMDEWRPHMHIMFVPIVKGVSEKTNKKTGEVTRKEVNKVRMSEVWKGFNSYGFYQDWFHAQMTAKGFDIDRGQRKIDGGKEYVDLGLFKANKAEEARIAAMFARHPAPTKGLIGRGEEVRKVPEKDYQTMKEATQTLAAVMPEVQTLRKRKKSLYGAEQRAREEKEALEKRRAELDTLERSLDPRLAELDEKLARIKEVQQENAATVADIDERWPRVQRLDEREASLGEREEELDDKARQLEIQSDQQREHWEARGAHVAGKELRAEQREKELDKREKDDKEKLRQDREALEAEKIKFEELKQQHDKYLDDRVAEIKKDRTEWEDKFAAAVKKHNDGVAEFTEQANAVEASIKERWPKVEELDEREKALDERKEGLDTRQTELEEGKRQLETDKAQVKKDAAKVKSDAEAVAARERAVKPLEEKVNAYKDVEAITKVYEGMAANVAAAKKTIEDAGKAKEQAAKLAELQTDVAAAKKTIEDAGKAKEQAAKLAELQTDVAAAKKTIEEAGKAKEQAAKLAELQTDVAAAKKTIEDAGKAKEQAAKLAGLSDKVAAAEAKIAEAASLPDVSAELAAKVTELGEVNAALEAGLQSLRYVDTAKLDEPDHAEYSAVMKRLDTSKGPWYSDEVKDMVWQVRSGELMTGIRRALATIRKVLPFEWAQKAYDAIVRTEQERNERIFGPSKVPPPIDPPKEEKPR